MKRRLPNTTIYLDTADFIFTSTPIETDIEVGSRFVTCSTRSGGGEEQTIKGNKIFENGITVDIVSCTDVKEGIEFNIIPTTHSQDVSGYLKIKNNNPEDTYSTTELLESYFEKANKFKITSDLQFSLSNGESFTGLKVSYKSLESAFLSNTLRMGILVDNVSGSGETGSTKKSKVIIEPDIYYRMVFDCYSVYLEPKAPMSSIYYCDLGKSDYPFKDLYLKNSLIPSGDSFSIGTSEKKVPNIHSNDISTVRCSVTDTLTVKNVLSNDGTVTVASLQAHNSSSSSIGDVTPFKSISAGSIYGNAFHGILPSLNYIDYGSYAKFQLGKDQLGSISLIYIETHTAPTHGILNVNPGNVVKAGSTLSGYTVYSLYPVTMYTNLNTGLFQPYYGKPWKSEPTDSSDLTRNWEYTGLTPISYNSTYPTTCWGKWKLLNFATLHQIQDTGPYNIYGTVVLAMYVGTT